MPGDVGSIEYTLREPFERAVETVCKSLASRGLRVAGQMDVSRRISRALGIVPAPCRIVFVLPGSSLLNPDTAYPWAAIFLPLHIVISGNGCWSEIQVQNRVQTSAETVAPAFFGPVMEAQAQVAEALEAIAMRPSIVA